MLGMYSHGQLTVCWDDPVPQRVGETPPPPLTTTTKISTTVRNLIRLTFTEYEMRHADTAIEQLYSFATDDKPHMVLTSIRDETTAA